VSQLSIFLDDGGVMSDNQVRAPQWQRMVGEFLAPRLGGTPDAWAAANRAFTDRLFAPGAFEARLRAASDYVSFDRQYQQDWLAGMCPLVGVPMPPVEEAIALVRAAGDYITRRVHAAYPGAAAAIRTLHTQGYPLYTASGESSADLANYLEAMGVRACFRRLYGGDLINTLKAGPAFYAGIFADAGLAPAAALVVDDNRQALAWAAEVGARTVLVQADPPPAMGPMLRIGSLAELPALLEQRVGAIEAKVRTNIKMSFTKMEVAL
jgi:HAD superfamily hydrolase (TIGR01509 family)